MHYFVQTETPAENLHEANEESEGFLDISKKPIAERSTDRDEIN